MSSLLDVRGLRKSYGGVNAVADANLTVTEGEIVGLIGPNGAGKTTTFDLVAGDVRADRGAVTFAGQVISGWPSYKIAQAGLVRTYQTPRTFNQMSVWENLLFAGDARTAEHFWVSLLALPQCGRRERELAERATAVLDFLELDHTADLSAGSLSGGQRKLLELARAMMRDPRLLLLDEPFAGVAPELRRKIAEKLRDLRRRGHTIVLIEHDLETVMSLVDTLIVMHLGAVLTAGDPTSVRQDERVLEAYLGRAHV